MKIWELIRPGVRLSGTWGPDVFDYPFRFEGPKVGDTVYVIVRHRKTKQFKVVPDRIAGITDFGEGKSDAKTFLINYWLNEHSPGYGLTFGDALFESEEDALEVLSDIEANLDRWDA